MIGIQIAIMLILRQSLIQEALQQERKKLSVHGRPAGIWLQ